MKLNAFFLALLLPLAVQASDHYTPYTNARFRFSVEIPTTLFVPQLESDNGDGRVFLSKNGQAEIRVYGGWLMEPEIPCSASEVFDKETVRVTYTHSKGKLSVVSGYIGTKIFYVKTIRTTDRCLNLVITYPSQDRGTFDGIIKHVTRSFDG